MDNMNPKYTPEEETKHRLASVNDHLRLSGANNNKNIVKIQSNTQTNFEKTANQIDDGVPKYNFGAFMD